MFFVKIFLVKAFEEVVTPIFDKLLHKIEKKWIIAKFIYDSTVTLIPKPHKD